MVVLSNLSHDINSSVTKWDQTVTLKEKGWRKNRLHTIFVYFFFSFFPFFRLNTGWFSLLTSKNPSNETVIGRKNHLVELHILAVIWGHRLKRFTTTGLRLPLKGFVQMV